MNFKNLDADTAFKAGFAVRCAEEKLTEEEISARIKFASALLEKESPLLEKEAYLQWAPAAALLLWEVAKRAFNPKTYAPAVQTIGALGKGVGAIGKGVGTVGTLGLGMGGLAGGLGGGALGWAAAKANEKDIDVEDIKAKEIQQTYNHYAQRMAARRAYEKERAKRINQPV